MELRHRIGFWALVFAAFLGFIFVFQSVLLPFVVGAAVAYLLNPAVNGLGRIGLARGVAALVILGGFFLCLLLLFLIVAPLFYKQALELARNFPGYMEQVVLLASPYIERVLTLMGLDGEALDFAALSKQYGRSVFSISSSLGLSLAGGLAAGGRAVIDVVSLLVFMPLVAYFLMKEWVVITQWVEDLLPRDHKETIMKLVEEIDGKISGFIRGQLMVAAFLAIIYALALSIAGLKYGFLIGIGAGILSVIPMVGSIVGFVVAVLVAWFQAGDFYFVALIGGIFIGGQVLEGNFLTPKLVGESVGLHPLWVFFALLAGGALFGVLGMFLAVPVAAIAGVLLGFMITVYKGSAYFKGQKKAPTKKTSTKTTKAKAASQSASKSKKKSAKNA